MLTQASEVLILDPWWNPAIEQQATDRAHRIGQTEPVTVYRFVSQNTIEAKIRELHQQKTHLAYQILEGGDQVLSLDNLLENSRLEDQNNSISCSILLYWYQYFLEKYVL